VGVSAVSAVASHRNFKSTTAWPGWSESDIRVLPAKLAARAIGVPVIAQRYAVLRTYAASEIPRLRAAPMMPGSAIIVSTA